MNERHEISTKLFKIGYTAKGIVYFLVGGFAVATVAGLAGGVGGPKRVIQWIGSNPFGQVLLGLTALGLACYAAWRIYHAVQGPRRESDGKEATVKRIAWVVSGLSYGLLAVFAARLALVGGNVASGGSGGKKQDVIQWLLQQSWGPIAVGIIGVIMLGVGAFQVYRAVTDKHMTGVEEEGNLAPKTEKFFRRTGRVGLVSRAVVFAIIAYFLGRAALMDDASQFRGVSGSLSFLRDQSYGAVLLAAVGAGLLAYGFFMFVRARYERAS